jgi:F-type H+-transporting ATPase subunit b
MQTLEVISVNIWNIVISLANLVILFLLVKKFLFKPVMKILSDRQAAIDTQYAAAAEAEKNALENKAAWEEKLTSAGDKADSIIKSATETAARRGDEIIADAKEKADGIVKQAENEAELKKKKAEEEIKHEIVDISSALTEKLLEREISTDDHHRLISSFIDKIGDSDDGNK